MTHTHTLWIAVALACLSTPAWAQPRPETIGEYAATGRADAVEPEIVARGSSRVTRADIEERTVTSPPDALRYEAGVAIQQTAHGQASPFVRGLTGQQVVHLFDGVRLNHSLYRRGPNQYFFNLDSETIAALTVVRGSSSVLYGSDALGGAIVATPMSPAIDPQHDGVSLHPELSARLATADVSAGGRVALRGQLGSRTAFLLGGGYFDASLLQASGQIAYPADASTVPRFDVDRRAQLGTGYHEATFDARVVHQLTDHLRLTGALYGYRQGDAPRTDQCPRAGAPIGDCLVIEQQHRTLAYVTLDGDVGQALRDLRLTVSWQQSDERRRDHRPSNSSEQLQDDRVTTLGVTGVARTRAWSLGEQVDLSLRYGVDAYFDQIRSDAQSTMLDTGMVSVRSRGQYLTGSTYLTSGVHGETTASIARDVELRLGARGALSNAHVPSDPESGSRAIDRAYTALVARAGVSWRPLSQLALLANVDQGFRAPSLDDLSARQTTGAGFQIENPALTPERSLHSELGVRWDGARVSMELWGYWLALHDAILRVSRSAADCPPDTPQCMGASSQLTLINASDRSDIVGTEARVTFSPIDAVQLRATVSYAYGTTPNTASPTPEMPSPPARVPFSRIPPLQGTTELTYRDASSGLYAGLALRWAAAQTRLAPSDATDPRIPASGTPAFAVFELRGGYRIDDRLRINLAIDNVFDTTYRVHGSSINGAARQWKVAIHTVW